MTACSSTSTGGFPDFDPIWAAAQAHAMPVSFHVGTGSNPVTERGPGGAVINYVEVGLGAQRTLAYLATSGVLERFPELHVVMVECGAGWLSWLLERMDEAFEEHAQWVNPKLGGKQWPRPALAEPERDKPFAKRHRFRSRIISAINTTRMEGRAIAS